MTNEPVQLTRDCQAIAIPSGVEFTIEKGTQVMVTQALGGSYTITSKYGLSRVSEQNSDALGMDKEEASSSQQSPSEPFSEKLVWEQLKRVYDPEIPVNIVDLGLIYSVVITPVEDGLHTVEVKMTLTAPGCGMGPVIQADARSQVLSIPGVKEAQVELVWDPPWHQEMISEAGKMKLGML